MSVTFSASWRPLCVDSRTMARRGAGCRESHHLSKLGKIACNMNFLRPSNIICEISSQKHSSFIPVYNARYHSVQWTLIGDIYEKTASLHCTRLFAPFHGRTSWLPNPCQCLCEPNGAQHCGFVVQVKRKKRRSKIEK